MKLPENLLLLSKVHKCYQLLCQLSKLLLSILCLWHEDSIRLSFIFLELFQLFHFQYKRLHTYNDDIMKLPSLTFFCWDLQKTAIRSWLNAYDVDREMNYQENGQLGLEINTGRNSIFLYWILFYVIIFNRGSVLKFQTSWPLVTWWYYKKRLKAF